MYRIRFHGRGGQGTKTAAQVLGTAFFLEGFEAQDAPRYGAERRGAPMSAYVRAGRTPIHERGVIARPDLVIVSDETLVAVPAAGVLEGMTARTVLLINSSAPSEEWRARLELRGPVLTLRVGAGVGDRNELPLIGATCTGAAARLVGVISRERLAEAIHAEIGKLGAVLLQRNLEQTLAAFDAMAANAGMASEGAEIAAARYERPAWVDLPLDAVQAATPQATAAATSVLVKTGVWRTQRPVIDYRHCHRCSWICSTLCPDSAIPVAADRTPRIDYDHCKGCMICAAVCPSHAIAIVPEREAQP